MKRSTRVFTLFIAAELGLAALWWWLLASLRSGELRPSGNLSDAITTVSSTLGSVMGVIAGVMLFTWFFLKRAGH